MLRALQAARSFTFHTLPQYAQRLCHVRYHDAPTSLSDHSQVSPEFSESLDRLIRDHADVWAKLAKY